MSTTSSPFSAKEPWDLVAEGYAAETSLVMDAFAARAIELAAVRKDASVLDVATGPGTVALRLAHVARRVDAIDFSPRMIAELERAAARAGARNLHARVGDGQELPFSNDTYGAAFSMFGLMFFPDRARGFAEMRRVLEPGGVAVVSAWAPVDESPLMTAMFGALRAADPDFPVPRKDVANLENPEVLAAEMRGGGFVDVSVHRHRHTVPPLEAGELWERMVRSSAPLVLLRTRLGEREWGERTQKAKAFLAGWLEQGPEISTSAWLAVGYKPR